MPSKRRLAELERRRAKLERQHRPDVLIILQQDLDDPAKFWQDDRLLTDDELRRLEGDPNNTIIKVTYDRTDQDATPPARRPAVNTDRKVDYRRDVWALAPPTRRNTPGA